MKVRIPVHPENLDIHSPSRDQGFQSLQNITAISQRLAGTKAHIYGPFFAYFIHVQSVTTNYCIKTDFPYNLDLVTMKDVSFKLLSFLSQKI